MLIFWRNKQQPVDEIININIVDFQNIVNKKFLTALKNFNCYKCGNK